MNKGSGILLTKSVTQSFQHGAQNHFVFTMAEWLYAWGIKIIKRNLNKENTTNLYEVTVTNTVVPRFWWIWLNSRFALFETFLTHTPRCGKCWFSRVSSFTNDNCLRWHSYEVKNMWDKVVTSIDFQPLPVELLI